jgi:ABC-type molybdate transport system substrate-binding protein
VAVLYDSSLDAAMEGAVGSGFHAETGYAFEGFSAPTAALASQIAGRAHVADVLVAAGTAADEDLMGAADGGQIAWYATFARSRTTSYTVTVLNNAPDPTAAQSFVRYLLGPAGISTLQSAGLRAVVPPVVVGTGVPEALDGVLAP